MSESESKSESELSARKTWIPCFERPSFFRRSVLDLELKTSNSARLLKLVLLKSNEHYAK